MVGYEELTAGQLIFIVELFVSAIIIWSVLHFLGRVIEMRTVKYIEVKIKKELNVEPKSTFSFIHNWRARRKEKKKDKDEFPLG